MKIIAGNLGGRRFNAPRGNRTHPMSDKVRGALFNSLGDISDITVLDAFAGSGALGFEALSRDAAAATLIDSDKKAYFIMQENVADLGLNKKSKIIRANVSSWSDNNPEQRFSLILLDPPYNRLQIPLLHKLCRHLEAKGCLVISLPGKHEVVDMTPLHVSQQKKYGDIQLLFYRFAS